VFCNFPHLDKSRLLDNMVRDFDILGRCYRKERSGGDGDGAVEQQKGGSETMSKLHSAHSFLFTQTL
jgi:hypothetical protein